MLRASAQINNTVADLQQVNGETSEDSTFELSNELMSFATAVATRDEAALAESRERLLTASNAEVLVDAAAVAGNFQRMVRIADSIGIPLDEDFAPMAEPTVADLELRRFKTAENTPR